MQLQWTRSVLVLIGVVIVVALLVRKLLHGTKKDARQIRDVLKNAFLVRIERVKRLAFELQRKAFHIAGLIIPSAYIAALETGLMSRRQCASVLGAMATIQICIEIGRQVSPEFNKLVVARMKKTMREDELKETKVTGTPYFLTGNFMAIWLFAPAVAVMSQLYLVVGDFAAAFFGIAYGRHPIYGKKSLEGSLGCFVCCAVLGYGVSSWALAATATSTYTLLLVSVLSGLVATVVELVSDDTLYMNDNLTIPLSSGISILLFSSLLSVDFLAPGARLAYRW